MSGKTLLRRLVGDVLLGPPAQVRRSRGGGVSRGVVWADPAGLARKARVDGAYGALKGPDGSQSVGESEVATNPMPYKL